MHKPFNRLNLSTWRPAIFVVLMISCSLVGMPSAQDISTGGQKGMSDAKSVWTGVPKDFPVTHWPEESDLHPIPYRDWLAKQSNPQPFEARIVRRADPDKGTTDRGLFSVIVNTGLLDDIQTSLDQYTADLTADGYQVTIITSSGGTHQEFRSFLLTQHQAGMLGAVLIGDFPVAWYEAYCWESLEEFPCDLYYMDLDGNWSDSDGDGMYDGHRGTVEPEIWIGRLTASPMHMGGVDEVTLLKNYFYKNHKYRIGQMPLASRGLLYIDDDWQWDHDWWGSAMAMAYEDTIIVWDPATTVALDYEDHLDNNYECIQVCAHSDYLTHYFSSPLGGGGTTSVGTMVSIDPQAAFYNLFACSNSRYVETDYMGGWYIFCQKFGLASVGSTKTGSMLNFHSFYGPFGAGATFGEAFASWFNDVVWDGMPQEDICWFYGMTLCGDPTLRPGMSSCPSMINSYLSDEEGGDGDGIPEAGETIVVLCAFENLGAVMATDVTLSLSVNDADLIITDQYGFIGDIAPGSVGTDQADPMAFAIPADFVSRVDSLYIEFVWNGGVCVDTIGLERALGGAHILLVDDDNMSIIERHYTSYLKNLRIPYDTCVTATGYPSSGDLIPYDVVIWFTGPYRTNIISSGEVAAMQGYLDSGGNLFFTGQGLTAQLTATHPAFVENYLHAEYLSTGYIPVVLDIPGGQVFEFSDSLCITAEGGPNYQTHSEKITAVNGGVVELHYMGDTSCAVTYAGDYKLVYFSFGFECIMNNSDRWYKRDSVYADILDFFGYNRPMIAPRVDDLYASPGDRLYMLEHTPDITWEYFDPGGNPQTMYHVQVGEDEFWSTVEMWDYGPVPGSESSLTYAGAELEDGEWYFIRVRVFNGQIWSNWRTYSMRMNSIPLPTDLHPCDMEHTMDTIMTVTHDNPGDAEGDDFVYRYEFYDDAAMTILLASADSVLPGVDSMQSWEVPLTLTYGEDYYWRVGGTDEHEVGQWSELAGFWILEPTEEYMCGDANGDESADVGDAVFLINYIFKGGPAPDPECLGDANGDSGINVGDAVYVIAYVFKGGPAPVDDCCR